MNHIATWTPEQITFEVIAEMTHHPVVTLEVQTPIGPLWFMGEPVLVGRVMTARMVHAQGATPRSVGWVNLRAVADAVMVRMDLDGLVIEGAVRTTGACPGRRPRPLRFAPRRAPAAGPGGTGHTGG